MEPTRPLVRRVGEPSASWPEPVGTGLRTQSSNKPDSDTMELRGLPHQRAGCMESSGARAVKREFHGSAVGCAL